jgi:hypothetical protein
MKTKSLVVTVSGAAVAAFCLLGACLPQISNAQTEYAPPPPDGSVAPGAPDDSAALPSNVDPSSPLAQVIKLTQGGVSEAVIMAYVTNSGAAFNLDPDTIIYLKDIGTPDTIVQAMIQRDQLLQAQTAYQPPQPAPASNTTAVETTDVAPPMGEVTVNYFYDSLAPYGAWVDVGGYGRCWRPTVVVSDAGWQPYCDHGHWVYTDDGWYWMSDYSWGWATFHYGRWFRDTRFGWCWAPDTVWGPSWVTWRYSDDYCGWAPLPPRAVYREGAGFFYNGAAVSVGFDFGLGVDFFTFVPTRNFCDPHPRRYRVAPREVTQFYGRTTVINNYDVDRGNRNFINHGIDPGRITAVTRTEIHPVAIHDSTGPISRGEQLGRDGRTLTVNRPHFTDNPQPPNRGGSPRASSPSPAVGSPYQPPRNSNQNDNNLQPRRNQPAPVSSGIGSPSQPPRNGNENNNPQTPSRFQSSPPVQTPGQRQTPPVTTPGSPGRNAVTPPAGRSVSPDNRFTPVTPTQPQAPNNNLNNSTDTRRYPSPRMQQNEQQNPRANSGNFGGRAGSPVTPQTPANPPEANRFSTPAQPPQRNYIAPVTPPAPPASQPGANRSTPPVEQAAPAQPPQPNYVSPRNQASSGGPRSDNSQPPAAGNQSRGTSAPSSAPAQSQRSGGGRNQNGQ